MSELKDALKRPDLEQSDDIGEMADAVKALVENGNPSLEAFLGELISSMSADLPATSPPPEPPIPAPPTGGTGEADASLVPPASKLAVKPSPKTVRKDEATEADIKIARALDAIQARLRDVPSEAFVWREVAGLGKVRLYRPRVKLLRDRGRLVYVYDSLDPKDKLVAMTDADYERYGVGGEWAGRHMPMVTDTRFRELLNLFQGYSTYTNICSVGGEEFAPLLKSKARSFLVKQWRAPFSELNGEQLRFARTCYHHWTMDQLKANIQQAWMQATVDLQDLPGDAFQAARVDRMKELINEVHQKVSARNPRVTRAEVAEAFAAYAQSLTKDKERNV